ncbi:hypothetical protein ACQSFN_26710, partial [Klebsiella pneumoniae]
MMKKETLNTLILRHGDRMLRQAGCRFQKTAALNVRSRLHYS